jgi:hypothetical protein
MRQLLLRAIETPGPGTPCGGEGGPLSEDEQEPEKDGKAVMVPDPDHRTFSPLPVFL